MILTSKKDLEMTNHVTDGVITEITAVYSLVVVMNYALIMAIAVSITT